MDKIKSLYMILYESILFILLMSVTIWYVQQPQYQMIENIPLFQRLAPWITIAIMGLMMLPAFTMLYDKEEP